MILQSPPAKKQMRWRMIVRYFRQSKIQNRKSKIDSFNHLIRFHQKMRRNLEPQSLGRLEIDHQLELRRPFYREIRGLGSLDDLINADCRTPGHISQIG